MNFMKNRKVLTMGLMLFLAALLFAFTGCSKNSGSSGAEPGKTAETPKAAEPEAQDFEIREYRKIISLSAGAVETIYLLGGEDHLAGIGSSRQGIWPEEKTSKLPSVGSLARPSLESILALEPDLVILNGMVAALKPEMESRGIPVWMLSTKSMDALLQSILDLGVITGQKEKARKLHEEKTAQLKALEEKVRAHPLNLKGMVLYAANPMTAFTEESLPGEILSLLGVKNLAAGLKLKRPILSPEYVLKENPDFIFCSMSIRSPEDLLEANPALKNTRAGREKNISILSSSFLLRPSPRLFDELPDLVSMLEGIKQ